MKNILEYTRALPFECDEHMLNGIRGGMQESLGSQLMKELSDGRSYVVSLVETREDRDPGHWDSYDTLTITTTVLLARIEDAKVGEFISAIGIEEPMFNWSRYDAVIDKERRSFQRVSEAAWKRVE